MTHNALVLSGGGARGAYQVGVLKAIQEILPGDNPVFQILTGASVGAINAAWLATRADQFAEGIGELESMWRSLHAGAVYQTGIPALGGTLRYFLGSLFARRTSSNQGSSLLNNRPLELLLARHLDFARIQQHIEQRRIRALGISASSYTSGRAITFFQGSEDIEDWQRSRRIGLRCQMELRHVMASISLPIVFPTVLIGGEYCGDGSLRLNAPLSPAIHLGADRMLVIGVRDNKPDTAESARFKRAPSPGSIIGHLLDIAFGDNLDADYERQSRINQTLSLMNESQRAQQPLRKIDLMRIQPSKDIRDITERHVQELPWSIKRLMKTIGGWGQDWRLPSYLLFEPGFIGELIDLGYQDGLAQRGELSDFLSNQRKPALARTTESR